MTDDLVERLRKRVPAHVAELSIFTEAAEEIESLRNTIEIVTNTQIRLQYSLEALRDQYKRAIDILEGSQIDPARHLEGK